MRNIFKEHVFWNYISKNHTLYTDIVSYVNKNAIVCKDSHLRYFKCFIEILFQSQGIHATKCSIALRKDEDNVTKTIYLRWNNFKGQ